MGKLRDVIEAPLFALELARVEPETKRADEATHALTFALARHPEWGTRVLDTPLWTWPVLLRRTEYLVYYRFDEERVELLSLIAGDNDDPVN